MNKDQLLKIMKGMKYINCVCSVEDKTKKKYKELISLFKALQKDGKIKLLWGFPERCVSIRILKGA